VPKRSTGDSSDELDRPVVVRRPEPAGDDAEVRGRALTERRLELFRRVADDEDAFRLEPERDELTRDERPVQVVAISSNELAAGDDDERARAAAPYADGGTFRIVRGVTISFSAAVRPGMRRTRPLTFATRFAGLPTAIQRRR
jgi:hypothetical protein